MSAFKILDKDDKPIPINKLDDEVASLWGFKAEDAKEYAKELSREEFSKDYKGCFEYASQSNWYDTIGWMIASEGKSFQDILNYYSEVMKDFIGQKDEDGNIITLETIYPKRVLILNTWINKGYQPKQVFE